MANFLTTADMKTVHTVYKSNLGGAGDAEFLQWSNFLNQEIRDALISINPEDFLSNRIIKTISNISEYAIPSNFQNAYVGGLHRTVSGTTHGAINYDAETIAFTTIPQTITGGISGATGTIAFITDYGTTGTLTMINIVGDFEDNELLTGSVEGSATSNGGLLPFRFTDKIYASSRFGSQLRGWWIDLVNINLTPIESIPDNEVFVFRYIPLLADLTTISQETVIPIRYKQAIRNAMDVFWQQWKQDQNSEILSSQRSQAAIQKMLVTIKKQPAVLLMPQRRTSYTRTSRRFSHRRLNG